MQLITSLIISLLMLFSGKSKQESYVCMPCGSDCDKVEYTKAGECEHCHMQLIAKSSVTFGSIKPEEVCSYVSLHKQALVLDVRTKDEFDGKTDDFGTIKHAVNIPIQELEQRMGELSRYKSQAVIVYCSHSKRSPQASYLLTQNGFSNVINMEGGMSTMKDATCKKKK